MQSAFGVDHGEVSKAARPPKGIGGFWGRGTRAQARTAGTGGTSTRTEKVTAKLNEIGEADVSLKGIGNKLGSGAEKSGSFMRRHPGLTGTAAVGGGSAVGYKILSNKEPKRRKGAS